MQRRAAVVGGRWWQAGRGRPQPGTACTARTARTARTACHSRPRPARRPARRWPALAGLACLAWPGPALEMARLPRWPPAARRPPPSTAHRNARDAHHSKRAVAALRAAGCVLRAAGCAAGGLRPAHGHGALAAARDAAALRYCRGGWRCTRPYSAVFGTSDVIPRMPLRVQVLTDNDCFFESPLFACWISRRIAPPGNGPQPAWPSGSTCNLSHHRPLLYLPWAKLPICTSEPISASAGKRPYQTTHTGAKAPARFVACREERCVLAGMARTRPSLGSTDARGIEIPGLPLRRRRGFANLFVSDLRAAGFRDRRSIFLPVSVSIACSNLSACTIILLL